MVIHSASQTSLYPVLYAHAWRLGTQTETIGMHDRSFSFSFWVLAPGGHREETYSHAGSVAHSI